jgi:hypothetical protein
MYTDIKNLPDFDALIPGTINKSDLVSITSDDNSVNLVSLNTKDDSVFSSSNGKLPDFSLNFSKNIDHNKEMYMLFSHLVPVSDTNNGAGHNEGMEKAFSNIFNKLNNTFSPSIRFNGFDLIQNNSKGETTTYYAPQGTYYSYLITSTGNTVVQYLKADSDDRGYWTKVAMDCLDSTLCTTGDNKLTFNDGEIISLDIQPGANAIYTVEPMTENKSK